MTKMSQTILFFGSGPVAARSLELLAKNFTVEAIITKPTTIKEMSEAVPGIPVHVVANKQELDELIASQPFKSPVGVLIDFGIIVSRQVIDSFPEGIVNSHFSLLPKLRGADPISFAILTGEAKTGVSLMLIDEHMDTGKLIGQRGIPVAPDDTTPTLTQKLITLSDQMLQEYLPPYINGSLKAREQPHPDRATYSRKLSKEDGIIDWNKPAIQLEREIRAFAGWPRSRTTLGGINLTITKAAVQQIDYKVSPCSLRVEEKRLFVGTVADWLELLMVQPDGKNEMTAQAFLAGYGQRLALSP